MIFPMAVGFHPLETPAQGCLTETAQTEARQNSTPESSLGTQWTTDRPSKAKPVRQGVAGVLPNSFLWHSNPSAERERTGRGSPAEGKNPGMYVCVCNFHVIYVHCMCSWFPWRPEQEVRSPGTGAMDSCELPRGCWQWNWSSQVHLTFEPS